MSHTITIRVSEELAAWLEDTATKTGVSRGKIVREQLERARTTAANQGFMHLAGRVKGPKGLSSRKGFSRA
jgi:predicted transcriptional regulator